MPGNSTRCPGSRDLTPVVPHAAIAIHKKTGENFRILRSIASLLARNRNMSIWLQDRPSDGASITIGARPIQFLLYRGSR
jgi:hypothetical protein